MKRKGLRKRKSPKRQLEKYPDMSKPFFILLWNIDPTCQNHRIQRKKTS
jgi:hypothetical protein